MYLSKNQRLRELLARPGIVPAATCYDALSALIAEKAGFELIGMGGNGAIASELGYPDLEIATLTEMVEHARHMAARLRVPMFADADAGYGVVNNLVRTVRDYENAGVSAIHIEDQLSPKKCGAMDGLRLIDADLMVERIRAAVAARRDPNFAIIARTDSYKVIGLEECLRRCKMFYEAGADILMPELIANIDDLKTVGKLGADMPLICDINEPEYNHVTANDCYEMGFKICIRSMVPIIGVSRYLEKLFTYWHENGIPSAENLITTDDIRYYEKFLRIDEESELRDRYHF